MGWATMLENNDKNDLLDGVNEEKRETLAKLSKAAWSVPVVATFSLGALNASSNWAHAANATTS